jgi:mRNA-degrading endonuclease toxin of MazEF toxin-antitoxin module
LIIQNDTSNRLSEITIVAPITSTVRFRLNPLHVLLAANQVTGLAVTSIAVFNQIRAVESISAGEAPGRRRPGNFGTCR